MISLEKLCLNLIVQQFERFHFAFTVSKDEALKLQFEFLQKQFSFELASELHKKNNLKDEYMEFIMNKHLKFLVAKWFRNSDYLYFMEDILCNLPNITKISFSGYCCDEILENIARFCPKVNEINMTSSDVTDHGIQYLCKNEKGTFPCPQLTKICLMNSEITEEGVAYLIQNLPFLEVIDHPHLPEILYSLHKEDLPKLEKGRYYNLVDLKLLYFKNASYYADLLKICLTLCPRLKSIACYISDEEQLNLFVSNGLEELYLKRYRSGSGININNFLKCKGLNLVSLKVYDCIMSISDLVISCPKLKQLFMSNVTFLDDNDDHDDYDSQRIFHCLTECTFQKTKDDSSTKKAMRFLLSSSPKLESMSFRCIPLFSDIKTDILKCCENHLVKEITFECSKVDVKFVRNILLSCPSLTSLNLLLYYYYLRNRDRKELYELAAMLPNKPNIIINDMLDNSNYDSEEENFGPPRIAVTWYDYLETDYEKDSTNDSDYLETDDEEELNNDFHSD